MMKNNIVVRVEYYGKWCAELITVLIAKALLDSRTMRVGDNIYSNIILVHSGCDLSLVSLSQLTVYT